jgi:N-acetylneuraminic acid mutarotase
MMTYFRFFCLIFFVSMTFPAFAEEPWVTGAPATHPRGEASAVVLDGKIYLIGGFTAFGITNRVEVYDPATKKWKEKAPLPASLHHVGVGVIDKKIYVVGGFEGMMFWDPVKTVWEYNPKLDQWRERKPMPTARGALGVAIWQGKLYAMGGFGETPFGKGNLDANEVYDPATDRWESKSPLPIARDHLAVAVLDGTVHLLGGRFESSYSRNLSLHDVYNPKTDKWSSAAPLRIPRSGMAAAVLQGKIHLFGGEAPEGTSPDHEIYDPQTDDWTRAAPMPTARHGLAAAAVGNKIYLLTGGLRPGPSISSLNEVFTPTLIEAKKLGQ